MCSSGSILSSYDVYSYQRMTYLLWQPLPIVFTAWSTVYSRGVLPFSALAPVGHQLLWGFCKGCSVMIIVVRLWQSFLEAWYCRTLTPQGPSMSCSVFRPGRCLQCALWRRWCHRIQGGVEVIWSVLPQQFCLRQMSTTVGSQLKRVDKRKRPLLSHLRVVERLLVLWSCFYSLASVDLHFG